MYIKISKKTFHDWLRFRLKMLNLGYKYYIFYVTEDSRAVLGIKDKNKSVSYYFGERYCDGLFLHFADPEVNLKKIAKERGDDKEIRLFKILP